MAERRKKRYPEDYLDAEGHMNLTYVRPHDRHGTDGVRGHVRRVRIRSSGLLPLPDGSFIGYVRFDDGSAFESGPLPEREARAYVRRNGGTVRA